ncbi:LamG-like jellyroll fold domain-containing protein [Stieleria sp.]|uniref:LamG-like jellyroll fold domain-containing protein n=1 Tax=Stieleria sp. TaxID=2795976 RepID=UPI0035639773
MSEAEVQANYDLRVSSDSADLQAYWPLSLGAGTTANDLAGANDGTINGGEIWDTVTLPPLRRAVLSLDGSNDGVHTTLNINQSAVEIASESFDSGSSALTGGAWNIPFHGGRTEVVDTRATGGGTHALYMDSPAQQSVQLDGTNDYIDLPAAALHNSIDFSVSFWMKTSDTNMMAIGGVDSSNASELYLYYFGNNQAELNTGAGFRYFTLPGNFNDGVAHHYGLVRETSANEWYLYFDGALASSVTGGGAHNALEISDLELGRSPAHTTLLYAGEFDDVAIWNRAVTVDEVMDAKNGRVTTKDLVGHWEFDEVNGTSSPETSGRSSPATLVNGPALTSRVTTFGRAPNEAIWTVDVTEVASPVLTFQNIDYFDEEDSLLNDSFPGSVNGDGVSISVDDGDTWYRIWGTAAELNQQHDQWLPVTIDLAAVADSLPISIDSVLQIKFQQYDDVAIGAGGDGRGFDEIEIIDAAGTTGATFESWIYPTEGSSPVEYVFSTDNGGFRDWSLYHFDGYWHILNGTGGAYLGVPVKFNEWTHLALVFDPQGANKGIRFYENGVEAYSNTTIGFESSSGNLMIGGRTGSTEGFAGRIDEFRVWDQPLSVSQIQDRMNVVVSVEPDGATDLIGYWPMNEGTGGVTRDLSSNRNSGTLVGNATWPADAVDPNEAIWTVNLNGLSDAVMTFQHTDFGDEEQPFAAGSYTGSAPADGISISANGTTWYPIFNAPDQPLGQNRQYNIDLAAEAAAVGLTLGQITQIKFQQYDEFPSTTAGRSYDEINIVENVGTTIEAWVRPTGGPDLEVVFHTNNGGSDWGLIHSSNIWFVSNGYNYLYTGVPVDDTKWQHVAVTFAPAGVSFYVDGVLRYENSLIGYDNSTTNLTIGSTDGASQFYEGQIDEVRVWDRPLNAAEITTSMNGFAPSQTPGLIADWPFNEGTGVTTADASLNTSPATLVGATWTTASDASWFVTGDTNADGPAAPISFVPQDEGTSTATIRSNKFPIFFRNASPTIDAIPNLNGLKEGQKVMLGPAVVATDVRLPVIVEGTFASSDVPQPIGPASGTVTTSDLPVSGLPGQIADVDIHLNIQHTFDADLDVFLIAPDGTRVELFSDVGAGNPNFTNTILDDAASVSINAGTAPFTGTFSPEGSLADFNGRTPNGVWQLEITDDSNSDAGSLIDWELFLTTSDDIVVTDPGEDDLPNLVTSVSITDPVGQTTSLVRNALEFDNDVLELSSFTLDGATNVTTTFWLKTAKTGLQSIVSGSNVSNDNEYLIYLQGSVLRLQTHNTSEYSWSGLNVTDDVYHHYAISRNLQTNKAELFVDGVSQGTKDLVNQAPLSISRGGLLVGQEQDSYRGGFNSAQALVGSLDELTIWNRALTAEEVNEVRRGDIDTTDDNLRLYLTFDEGADQTAGDRGPLLQDAIVLPNDASLISANVLGDSPRGYWRLGEANGANAHDDSPNNFTGTYENGAVLRQPGALTGNTAASFGASNSRVSIPDNPLLRPNALTIEAFVNVQGATNYDGVVMKTSTQSWNDGYGLYYENNALHFFVNHWSNNRVSFAITPNQFTHVAATYDGANLRLYFDGVQVASKPYSTAINHSTSSLYLGWAPSTESYSFNGTIDEVAVYGTALTAVEIQNHRPLGLSSPQWTSTTPPSLAAPFTATDDGTYTLSITTSDGEDGTDRSYTKFDVANVAPTINSLNETDTGVTPLSLGGPPSGPRAVGTPMFFNARDIVDPGAVDGFTYLWEVTTNNGQAVITSSKIEFAFTPQFAGTYTVKLTVADADGGTSSFQEAFKVNPTPRVTAVAGQIRHAVVFNDDLLELDHSVLNGAGDLTTAFWYQTTATNQQSILSGARGTSNAEANEFWLSLTPTSAQIAIQDSNRLTWNWAPTDAINDGVYHHFALVRDRADNTAEFFIDGVSQGVQTFALPTDPLALVSGGLVVGQDQDSVGGGFQANQAMFGSLAELAVWTRSLSAAEIEAARDGTIDAADADLGIWLKLDEGTGETAADSGPENLDVSFTANAPTWAQGREQLEVLTAGALVTFASSDSSPVAPTGLLRGTNQSVVRQYSWTIGLGGTTVATGTAAEIQFVPIQSGVYTATLAIDEVFLSYNPLTEIWSEQSRLSNSETTSFTVQAAPPLTIVVPSAAAQEGDLITFSIAGLPTVDELATRSVVWSVTPNTFEVVPVDNAETFSIRATADDTYVVSVSVTDLIELTGSPTQFVPVPFVRTAQDVNVRVENAAPRMVVDSVAGTENTPINLIALVIDAGVSDTHTYSVDWGDGTSGLVDQTVLNVTAYAKTVRADQPLLQYQFNEASGSNTASNLGTLGNSHDATLPGTIDFAADGVVGGAVQIGAAGAGFAPNAAVPAGALASGSYSIEVWFKPDALTPTQDILSAVDANGFSLLLETASSGRIRFLHRVPGGNAGGQDLTSSLTYSANAWNHLVAVNDNGTMRLFLNGVEDSVTLVSTGVLTGALDFAFGALAAGGNTRLFEGSLDEVAIYDRALSAADVQRHYVSSTAEGAEVREPLVFATHTYPQDGSYTAILTVTDSDTASRRVNVQMTIGNAAPIGVDDSGLTTDEDTPLTIDTDALIANDTDLGPADVLSFDSFGAVSSRGATITLAGGVLTYDPTHAASIQAFAAGQTETDTFHYVVTDDFGDQDTVAVTVAINGVNDAPKAKRDENTVDEDAASPVIGNLLVGDTDVDHAVTLLSVSKVNGAVASPAAGQYGSLTWNSDGSYSYALNNNLPAIQRLNAGDKLFESFSYEVTDQDKFAASTLTITINGTSDDPIAGDDDNSVSASDAVTVVGGGYDDVVLADSPVAYWQFNETSGTIAANELSPLSPDGVYSSSVQLARTGLVGLDLGTSIGVGGSDSVTIADDESINSGAANYTSKTFEVFFNASDVSSAGSLYSQSDLSANNGFGLRLSGGRLIFEAFSGGVAAPDVSSSVLPDTTYHVVGVFDNASMTLYVNGQVAATGTASFTSVPPHPGRVVAGDLAGARLDELALYNSALSTQRVTDHYRAAGLLANDRDADAGDTRRVTAVTIGKNTFPVGQAVETSGGALVTVNADGSYQYDPNGAFASLARNLTDTDVFEYTVTDSNGLTGSATVTVTVVGENEAPTAVTISQATVRDSSPIGRLVGRLSTADVDVADAHSYVLLDNAGGLFSLTGREILVNAALTAGQTHPIRVRSDDGNGGTVEQLLAIEVVDTPVQADLNINLAAISSTDLTIRRNGLNIEIIDNTNAGASVLSQKLAQTSTVTVNGGDGIGEVVTVDFSSGGFFQLQRNITFNGGLGGDDRLRIIGDPSDTSGRYVPNSLGLGDASFVASSGQTSSTIRFTGVEPLDLLDLKQLTFDGPLEVGGQSLTVSSPNPINLPSLTEISGGTIATTGVLALGSAEAIRGSGTISGRIAAESGSNITATGNLVLGDATSGAGFHSAGEIHVGDFMVTLLDANQAVLGALTSLGNGGNPGTLFAANGVFLEGGNHVTGYGTLNTPNDIAMLTMITGSVSGTSPTQQITLPGYIGGNGPLDHVNITGTYSPGLSPAVSVHGSVSYSDNADLILELAGRTPGRDGYDQVIHTGSAALGGDLKVELMPGFTPIPGDSFVLMTAVDGITGDFANADLPAAPLGSAWDLSVGTNDVRLTLVDLAEVGAVIMTDGNNATQRSSITQIEVQFDRAVDVDAGAFQLSKTGTGGGVVDTAFTLSADAQGNTIATITFSGTLTRGVKFALVDGNYQLLVDPTKVRSAGTSITIDGDSDGLQGGAYAIGNVESDAFFAHFGDTDGDRDVDGQDYGRFGLSFLKNDGQAGFNPALDSDGDGDVDGQDYGRFGLRFLKRLDS